MGEKVGEAAGEGDARGRAHDPLPDGEQGDDKVGRGPVANGAAFRVDAERPQADEDASPAQVSSSPWDLQSPPQEKRIRNLPGVVWRCLTLVWAASPQTCVRAGLLQLVTGVAIAVELLAAKELLSRLLVPSNGEGHALVVGLPLGILLMTATLVALASVVQAEQQQVMSELVTRHVNARLLDITTRVDLQHYETPTFFDRLERAQVAGEVRPWRMTMGLLVLMGSSISVLAITLALLAIEPVLLPLVVVASIPWWVATARNSREAHAFAYEMTPADRERRYLSGILMGSEFAPEVRTFGVAPLFRQMHDALYSHRIARLRDLVRHRVRRSLLATVGTALLSGATLVILISLVVSERLQLAGAITAALAVQQLAVRLRNVYGSAGNLYEGSLFLRDFESFLRLGEARDEKASVSATAPPGFSTLTVENVSFEYPDTGALALANVSMEIRSGEVVALVGANGSGKTTLAKLLCHLYRPSSGRILWDGVDTNQCDAGELRRYVTGIFQNFAQYHLRARDNIAIGRYEWAEDLELIIAAAKHAGAHDFLSKLPEGYETRLGRTFANGRELSMGQWQRVALARAFFRAAPFIILDEPTAALDPRAERELFDSVRELAAGRTLLLISHRFSSVRSADRIFVLERGRLVEQGSHSELLAMRGLYATLFNIQASSYVDG